MHRPVAKDRPCSSPPGFLKFKKENRKRTRKSIFILGTPKFENLTMVLFVTEAQKYTIMRTVKSRVLTFLV